MLERDGGREEGFRNSVFDCTVMRVFALLCRYLALVECVSIVALGVPLAPLNSASFALYK